MGDWPSIQSTAPCQVAFRPGEDGKLEGGQGCLWICLHLRLAHGPAGQHGGRVLRRVLDKGADTLGRLRKVLGVQHPLHL